MTCWCCRLLQLGLLAACIALIVFAGVPLIEIGWRLYPYGI